ncbi:MAG: hypothetical protein WCD45_04280, partial [Gallionella sp.]
INPPYAEATNSGNTSVGADGGNKAGVAKTKFAATAMSQYGKASNELFTQFVARIALEIPTATLAMFSTLKYVNAPTLATFREVWNAKYLGGFVVHSQAFDGLNGDFPIGFLVWATNQNSMKKTPVTEITVEVLDKNAQAIGEKTFHNIPNENLLADWIARPPTNTLDAVPLKNAITPATATKDLRGTKWADGAIAWMNCAGNDLQNAAQKTMIFSSGYGSGRGYFVTSENLQQSAVLFAVRHLVKHTWDNHNDQFLQATQPLSDEFKSDCLLWMLFHGKNCTAGANDLEWNDKKWSLVNHFIPFTEAEVGAPDRFESDFMVQYLAALPPLLGAINRAPTGDYGASVGAQFIAPKNNALSVEARAVLDSGRTLWQAYFAHTDVRTVRDELKLNRPDVGWYQIRNALKKRNDSGDTAPVDFTPFESAYKILSEKLQPQVFELGFLR